MRMLIADDSWTLPPALEDTFARAARKLSGRSSGRKAARLAETMLVACNPGAAAARAPAAAARGDGCPPAESIPPCPPIDLCDQPELLACVLDCVGVALLNRGCIAEGRKLVQAALDLRREHLGPQHPATALSYTSRARVLRFDDQLSEAQKEVARAIKIQRKVYGASGLPLAATLTELGAIQLYQGDFRRAEKTAVRGLAILRRHKLSATDPNTSRLLDVQGRALEGRGKLAPAQRALGRAVELDERQVGTEHPKYATHLSNLATVLWARGKLDEARAGFEHTIYVYETVLGLSAHPNVIDVHANLGSVLVRLEKLEQARFHLCRALGLNRQLRGPAHTLVGNDHANLGRLYHRAGEREQAREQFKKALAIYKEGIRRRQLPRKHPYIAEAKAWLERC